MDDYVSLTMLPLKQQERKNLFMIGNTAFEDSAALACCCCAVAAAENIDSEGVYMLSVIFFSKCALYYCTILLKPNPH